MELLRATIFISIVESCNKSLKKVSEIIAKYCGRDSAKEFLDACDKLDFTNANRILDDTVKELTGYGSVSIALSVFADKFSQDIPKLSNEVSAAWSEADKVKVIDRYRERIWELIKESR